MVMKIIPFATNPHQKKDCSFVAIFARDGKPWEHYEDDPSKPKNKIIPTVLLNNRWDGKIGFPGGKVNPSETPIEGAIREVYEELHLSISPEQLEPVVSHETDKLAVHLFAYEVSFQELLEIQKQSTQAKHFGTEILGVFHIHLCNYRDGKGFSQFLQNRFSPTVTSQLAQLILTYGLLNEKDLKQIYQKAGLHFYNILSS